MQVFGFCKQIRIMELYFLDCFFKQLLTITVSMVIIHAIASKIGDENGDYVIEKTTRLKCI